MPDDLTRRAHAVFAQAIDVGGEQRVAFIDETCGDDHALRRKVEALVAALNQTGFLETPVDHRATAGDGTPHAPAISGYAVESVIGVGGMGTVYQAVQEWPRRRVALKIMRSGVATGSARRRFEFECEVLARLRHPGIAQLYEAGTHDDGNGSAPWFAMEFVSKALPITAYAETQGLDLRARIALLAAVCDAVQHGHLKGVIHRDLKPGNILIDENGQPKVIDFGVARVSDPDRAAITQQTNVGQLIGTLNYMSPEQCDASAGDVDVRADVYSLGVVLYEVLCGRLPHELERVPVVEALRVIQQDPPSRPSTANDGVPRDVEAILLKALEKNRERRYGSAGDLGADLRRYLDNEVIHARSMTMLYQLQLFTRRHRALIGAALAVGLTVVIGFVASVSFAIWAGSEASRRQAAELTALAERDEARWQAYVANVAAASYAHDAGEYQRMRRALSDADERHRDWEWRFLLARSERSTNQFVAHDDMVFSMDASPDGRRLVTGSRDGTIRIWDTATHALVAAPPGHDEPVKAVVFGPNGATIASASAGMVRVWDAATGAERRILTGIPRRVVDLDYSSRGVVAGIARNGAGRVWTGSTGELLWRFKESWGNLSGVSFSGDGIRLATWSGGSTLSIRNAATGRIEHTLHADANVLTAAWSSDDRRVAGATGASVFVWDAGTGAVLQKFEHDGQAARCLAFFAVDTRIAVGMLRTIRMWDLSTGRELAPLRGHEEEVEDIWFSQDGQRVHSAGWDGTVRVWEPDRTGAVSVLRGHESRVISNAFSPDGALVASGSLDGTVRLWDPVLGNEIGVIPAHSGKQVRAVAFSPDGALIATGSSDRTARLWRVDNGSGVATLEGHDATVACVAFSPDSRLLASGSSDTTIRLWDVASRTMERTLQGHTHIVKAVAFSPDGATIASASRDGTARLWDVRTGTTRHVLAKPGGPAGGEAAVDDLDVFAVVFSHDGRRVYTGSRDQTVRVWDTETGAQLDVFDGHGQFVTSLALSPDGRRLVGGSWYRKIVLWDLETGDAVATLSGHDDAIRSVAFDPSGRRIVSSSYDGTVRVWDSTTVAERERDRAAHGLALREAQPIVDRLFEELQTAEAVLDRLAALEPDAPVSRAVAVQLVLRRALGSP